MDHMARDYRALLVGYFNETLLRENEREVAKALKAMADEGNTILNFPDLLKVVNTVEEFSNLMIAVGCTEFTVTGYIHHNVCALIEGTGWRIAGVTHARVEGDTVPAFLFTKEVQ